MNVGKIGNYHDGKVFFFEEQTFSSLKLHL